MNKGNDKYPFAFDLVTGRHGFKQVHRARLSEEEKKALEAIESRLKKKVKTDHAATEQAREWREELLNFRGCVSTMNHMDMPTIVVKSGSSIGEKTSPFEREAQSAG